MSALQSRGQRSKFLEELENDMGKVYYISMHMQYTADISAIKMMIFK